MAYMISGDCISCAACETECRNAAISEGETAYVIDPEKCTECIGSYDSPRCAEVCPVEAPKPDPNRKETREQLLDKWRSLHPGEVPA